MKNKKIILVLILIIVGVFLLIKIKSNGQKNAVYKEIQPTMGAVTDIISTTGLVEPQNRLEIIPPISGRIEKIYVQEGQNVKAGQTLAIMSSTDRAVLLDAAQVEGPEKVKYWEEVYKPTALLAPIKGKVIVRAVEPGQTINTNTAVLVLADRLIVKAQVDETDIGQINVGQKVSLSLDAYPEIKISGKVGHISYESIVVNNVTIYEVEIIPDQVPAIFRSGMSANVNIIKSSKKDALLIPEAALEQKDGKYFVRIKANNKNGFEEVQIVTGASQDSQIEILSGLTKDSIVLIKEMSLNNLHTKKAGSFFSMPGRNRPKSSNR